MKDGKFASELLDSMHSGLRIDKCVSVIYCHMKYYSRFMYEAIVKYVMSGSDWVKQGIN